MDIIKGTVSVNLNLIKTAVSLTQKVVNSEDFDPLQEMRKPF